VVKKWLIFTVTVSATLRESAPPLRCPRATYNAHAAANSLHRTPTKECDLPNFVQLFYYYKGCVSLRFTVR
jgi:hypothetical protein